MAAEPAAPAATEQPPAVATWVVEPTLEADNIDVLRQQRGTANEQDYNAFAMHKDDGLCLIVQGGRMGLIDYDGNLVAPAQYDTVELGMYGRYVLSNGGGEFSGGSSWTLENNQLVSLAGASMVDTVGTAPNRVLYWVPERDSMYISGGVDTWLEAPYTAATPLRRVGGDQDRGRVRHRMGRLRPHRRHPAGVGHSLRGRRGLQQRADPHVPGRQMGLPERPGRDSAAL